MPDGLQVKDYKQHFLTQPCFLSTCIHLGKSHPHPEKQRTPTSPLWLQFLSLDCHYGYLPKWCGSLRSLPFQGYLYTNKHNGTEPHRGSVASTSDTTHRTTSTPEASSPVQKSQANLKDLPESTSTKSWRGETKVPQPQSKKESSNLNHSSSIIHTPWALPQWHAAPKCRTLPLLFHTCLKAEVR